MSNPNPPQPESPRDGNELDPRLAEQLDCVAGGESVDGPSTPDTDDAYDYAAAALQRTETEPMDVPAHVRDKWEMDAEAVFAREPFTTSSGGPVLLFWRPFLLGAFGAAALLALAFVGFSLMFESRQPIGDSTLARVTPELRGDAIKVGWSGAQPGYEGVAGTVTWSNEAQRGTMTFTGLPANDPEAGQYQLWIVDPTRDSEPVDGGVFDIVSNAEGKATVQFTPRLPIAGPTLFAVTYEKPGGVVVSEGPLLVVATVEG